MNLYKGQQNRRIEKSLTALPHISQCSKCKKYNSINISPEIKNISNCYFCRNPYYIIKPI